MSLARYPKYKKSGVEWLGEIPEHWDFLKLKYLATKITDGAHVSPETEGGEYAFVSTKDISASGIDVSGAVLTSPTSYASLVSAGCKPQKGDVLFSKDGSIGKTVVLKESLEIVVASSLIIIRPNESLIHPHFLHYLCQSAWIKGQVERFVKGAGLPRLSLQNLLKVQAVAPPLIEQLEIVAFLDSETSKIDALVAEQQRLIELLKEKRQAVITHAVTKGLNSDATMKDSGIEWLGKVPMHWGLKKFSYISTVVRGASPRPAGDARYFNGDYIPWITVGDVTRDAQMHLTFTESLLTKDGAELSRVMHDGTLVLTNSGATLGVPKILSITGCANDGILAFLNLDMSASKHFLYYYLTSLTDNLRDRMKQGSGQPNLNTDIVKALPLPWPDKTEQVAIAFYLDAETLKLDGMIVEATRVIDLLQERRTALISAAVTGKIDVRGLAKGHVA